jgi:hypothetical protein
LPIAALRLLRFTVPLDRTTSKIASELSESTCFI